MLEINLLPWREERRAQQTKTKLMWLSSFLSLFLLVGIAAYCNVTHQKGVEENMLSEQNKKTRSVIRINKILQKIKFIAYLNQDNRTWAMLMMPSGAINDVRLGSSIGVGKAKVVSISREKVVLVLPDNRLFSIPVTKQMQANNINHDIS